MKVLKVKNSWFKDSDLRLDAKCHLSEGRVAKFKVLKSPYKVEPLSNVTQNIYNGARFKRYYVEDKENGIPFMGSSDMLKSDQQDLKLISKKYSKNVDKLLLNKDWVLVSCSGTIGNTVYTNKDFEDKTASQHIMRIIPKENIKSGFLYAYLSSIYGYNLLTQGTYGAVIQHIEPHHIENLPVPLFPKEKQQQIHQLIVEASELRVEANRLLNEAVCFFDFLKTDYVPGKAINKNVSIKKLNNSKKRFDANYNIISSEVDRVIDNQRKDLISIVELSENIFIGPRTKRNYVKNGVPFLSTSEMQKLNPTKTEKSINHKVANDFVVKEGWLLTTRSGTLGDTIYTLPCLNDYAVSEDAIRIVLKKDALLSNKYLFAFLKSNLGKSSLLSGSYGSVILHLNEEYIGDIKVPILEQNEIQRIEEKIDIYVQNINNAILKENKAIALIEKEIDLWQVS